jgi:hypothetical protein
MKCKVTMCTYDTVEDINKTYKEGEHLQLLGFHVDPKPAPKPLAALQPASTHPRTEKIAYYYPGFIGLSKVRALQAEFTAHVDGGMSNTVKHGQTGTRIS